jgi:MFS family permease
VYVSAGRSADAAGGVPRVPVHRAGGLVAGNVVALGMVSLVTDISAEMVTAVLPLYLVAGLGLSPLAFGLLDGLYGGVTAAVRLLGGHVADRRLGHKFVAGVGYGLSAVCKPLLLAVGSSMPAIAAVLAADRTGKGLRTAPRDALISLSSPPGAQGRAFGVHRALDTTGALLGPLVAFGVLSVAQGGYDAVFVVSTCVAVFGVLILVLFVRDRQAGRERRPTVRATLAVLRLPGFARICACAMLLGVATISDAFVYLVLQQRTALPGQYFPLLPVGTAAAFLILAVPLGLMADRLGRWRIFLAGHLVLLLAYGLLLAPVRGSVLIVTSLALLGTFYAATDGVLMALAGPLLPESARAGGLAILQTGQAIARFACSLAFGAAWTWWGPSPALAAGLAALAAGAVTAGVLRPATVSSPSPDPPTGPRTGPSSGPSADGRGAP